MKHNGQLDEWKMVKNTEVNEIEWTKKEKKARLEPIGRRGLILEKVFVSLELFVQNDFRRSDAVEGEGIIDAGVGVDEVAQRGFRQRLRQV